MAEPIPGLDLTENDADHVFQPETKSDIWRTPSAHSLDSLFDSPPQTAHGSTDWPPQPSYQPNDSDSAREAIIQPVAATVQQDVERTTALERLNTTSPEDVRNILFHSKDYLSDLTPDSVQSHHPSIIPRSPNRAISRTHSMIGVAFADQDSVVQPLTKEALAIRDREAGTNVLVPALAIAQTDIFSFKKPLSAASQSRTFTIKTQFNSVDAASNTAIYASPAATGDSRAGSRPDTPRPFLVQGQMYNSIDHGQQNQRNRREEPWSIRSDVPSPTTHAASVSCATASIYFPSAEAAIQTHPELQQSNDLPPSNTEATHGNLAERLLWREPILADDMLKKQPPSSRSPSPLSGPRYAWQPTHLTDRTSDPFASGADEIAFSSVSEPTSSTSSQIVIAKRGQRKPLQETPSLKATETRLVSRARRVRATSRPESKADPQRGVQGAGVKVRKRSVSRARSSSRALQKGRGKATAEDVPDVPSMPDDMDVDTLSYRPATRKTTPTPKKGIARSTNSTPNRSARKATPKGDATVSTPEALAMLESDNTPQDASPSSEGRILRSSSRTKRNAANTSPTAPRIRKAPAKSAKPKGIIKEQPQNHKSR